MGGPNHGKFVDLRLFCLILLSTFFFFSQEICAGVKSHGTMAAKVAACPELPNVHWWRTTRIKIVEYVDFKYKGNWTPYIKKWQNYKLKMQQILNENGTALVKAKNIMLSGKTLAIHIGEIEKRLEVKRCLEKMFSGQIVLNKPRSSRIEIKRAHFTGMLATG